MIYSVEKGSSKDIQRVAINSSGGVVNLTGATISVSAKQFGDASITLFTKSYLDTTEIETIDATRGLFVVKLLAADTSTLNYKTLYCQQTIVVGGNTHTDTFYIRLKGVTTGVAIETFVQSLSKYVVWKSINGAAPVRILKAGFSGDVTAAIVVNTVMLSSVASEFEGQGEFNSNDKDFYITTSTSSSIVATFGDLSAQTISFWWGDPTTRNISNSGYTKSYAIESGTTAERTAYGLTLSATDRVQFFDDDDQSPYWWNGTAWV